MAGMFDPNNPYALNQMQRMRQPGPQGTAPTGQAIAGALGGATRAIQQPARQQNPWSFQGPGFEPGGVAGPQLPPQAQAPVTPAAQGGLGAFGNKLEGFDFNKMNSGHNSPKYQFGRVMSQFDPKGGITQGMLDQLNALGLGQISGKIGGDKISIGGQVDPRFEGVTEFDLIRDLENGGGWQWGGLNGKAQDGSPTQGQAIGHALGSGAQGAGGAFAPGFAGNAPFAASSWLQQLLQGLGVKI